MKKIVFITLGDAEFGFQLTGAIQHVAEKENLMDVLNYATADPDAGLLVVDERLLAGSNDDTMREIEKVWSGILVVLPSPERPGAVTEDYALRLIRRAIGYHVRLQV